MYDPYADFVSITLANGLQVHVLYEPKLSFVHANVVFRCGLYDDPVGKAGVAHFIEHMICANSGKTLNELREFLGRDGGQIVANTSTYRTCYGFKALVDSGRFVEYLDFWGQAVFERPLERHFSREQNVIRSEINRKAANEMLRRHFERKHQFIFHGLHEGAAPSPLGTRESFDAITLDDLCEQRKRCYVPQNAHLVCVGGLSVEAVVQSVQQSIWAQTVAGETKPPFEKSADVPLRPERYLEADLSQGLGGKAATFSQVAVLSGAMSIDAAQFAAQMIGIQLTEQLREQRGLVYSANAGAHEMANFLSFGLSANSFPREKLSEVQKVVTEVFETYHTDTDLFEQLKARAIASVKGADQNYKKICTNVLSDLVMYGRIKTGQEELEEIEVVTLADVRQMAQDVDPETFAFIVEYQ